MMTTCALCNGECAGVDLSVFLSEARRWLWTQLAAIADKRGDAQLTNGSVSVVAPSSAEERASVVGLLGTLAPGVRRRISLEELTSKLRSRAAALTPGALAAHAVERRLATKAIADTERSVEMERLDRTFINAFNSLEGGVLPTSAAMTWSTLRRNGWATKLLNVDDSEAVVGNAAKVIGALPPSGERIDRRRLASETLGDPHALDANSPVASFTLAVLAASGLTSSRDAPRVAWRSVGVEWDDITGGIVALGVFPDGWRHPVGSVVTIPPRVLERCSWPAPPGEDHWIFVTENPSIVSAAADQCDANIRLLCTSGTPSAQEIRAIDALAAQGWRVAVRADFDEAGIAHVNALLRGIRGSVPWRMATDDYRASLREQLVSSTINPDRLPSTPWDAALAATMLAVSRPAYEEELLPRLLEDLTAARPLKMSESASIRSTAWQSADALRNWFNGDPILDWLEQHGSRAGFSRDSELPGYDERVNFDVFLRAKRAEFKAAIVRLLEERTALTRVPASPMKERVDATIHAMMSGAAIIADAAVEDAVRGVFGSVDLLVRSDTLAALFPGALSPSEAKLSAARLPSAGHYRPVLLKYRSLEVTDTGEATGDGSEPDAKHMRVLALAVGGMQGLTPAAGYLLGRAYSQRKTVFPGSFDRLARVDVTRAQRRNDRDADAALTWLRSVDRDGGSWHVLPMPSVPELYPNMRNHRDAGWRCAKRSIAVALGELTLLPGVTPDHRRRAHAAGVSSLKDASATAESLGVKRVHAQRVNRILAAYREDLGTLLPTRFEAARELLDMPAALEMFVDVETVSNADDDFRALPHIGQRGQIVCIGAGYFEGERWVHREWIVEALSAADERRIIDAWIAWALEAAAAHGVPLSACRFFHWSAAEPTSIERAYRDVVNEQPATLPELPWCDLYRELFAANAAAVAGAYDLKLKSVCHALGLNAAERQRVDLNIDDGTQAMVAIWSAARATKTSRDPLPTHPFVRAVMAYNASDVRLLAELLRWVRANR